MANTRRRLASYTIAATGVVVKWDSVLMRVSDAAKPQIMGKIELMEEDELHEAKVTVRRYYRPHETIGGRRDHQGRKELFLSDQYETQKARTIRSKGNVHSVDNYLKLENVALNDFFCRFEYNASIGTFNPHTVDECFNCKKPYNPDNFMLLCVTCKDRFHSACLGKTDDEAKNLDQFTCSKCLTGDNKKKKAKRKRRRKQ